MVNFPPVLRTGKPIREKKKFSVALTEGAVTGYTVSVSVRMLLLNKIGQFVKESKNITEYFSVC